ncbi:hypothetical protein CR513_20735, partial [Mucuna pruriens]
MNEVVAIDNQRLENKITKLTSLVRQLAIGQHHIIIEPNNAEVAAMMIGQQYSQPHDQYSNMRYDSHPVHNVPQRYQPPPPFRQQQLMQHVQQKSLEYFVKQMATSNIQFQYNDFQIQISHYCESTTVQGFWIDSFSDHSHSTSKCECYNLEEWQRATTKAGPKLLKGSCATAKSNQNHSVTLSKKSSPREKN